MKSIESFFASLILALAILALICLVVGYAFIVDFGWYLWGILILVYPVVFFVVVFSMFYMGVTHKREERKRR